MWQVFREHHYLNSERLGAGVRCYVAKLDDKPVGFIAVAHVHMKARYLRVSRLVVLPDYQGIGVGKRLLNFVAEFFTSQLPEIPFYLVTSNPQLVRGNLERWKIKRVGHGSQGRGDTRINQEIRRANSRRRLSVSMQYIPERKAGDAPNA
jgi:GNAT superfamily N-acetyltransferase